ncbi:MAG: trehalose-phosphatase [Candidatus Sulfotelmatobacter sp.]
MAKAPLSVLLLDYDGTLAPFSANRQQALPYEGLTNLLQRIVDSGRTRLVIVTGRDAREVGPLLGLRPPPEVWGAHGLQRLWPDGICEMPEIPLAVERSLDDARRWLNYQGLQDLAEIKPGSIAVHWRGFDNAAASELRGRILLGWFRIAERGSLKLAEFDGGVEMRMPGFDKGHAVRTILKEIGDVPTAYLGDDATDEHAFRALGLNALTVLVRPEPRRTSARIWLRAPEELLEFLIRWAEGVETPRQTRSAASSE